MANQQKGSRTDRSHQPATSPRRDTVWEKYADLHRLVRITDFPVGVTAPEKVRLYARRDHYMLQWWDKQGKRTLNERVDGDLVAAISRAREIDERLQHFKTAGRKTAQFGHSLLIDRYLADQQRRADAGEIDIATVNRYASALQRHYRPFVEQPSVSRRYRTVASIDRVFQQEFAAFLANRKVSPNGHCHARPRPLKQQTFIVDTVRSMLEWAADPDRGSLLPDGFRDPFARRSRSTRRVADDLAREPDITIPMAVDLLTLCDRFQLAIFAPLVLYGLRPGELSWLFLEYVHVDWLSVRCIPDLDYVTKGRRNKTFPVLRCLERLWSRDTEPDHGLIYTHRRADRRVARVPLHGKSLSELVDEYRRRCAAEDDMNAQRRRKTRNLLMKDAGQLNYDHIQSEFTSLSRQLGWSTEATLKDLRHLFATALENAGVPEHYRKFFMGQSPGRAAIVTYTHLNEIRQRFDEAVERTLHPLVGAIERRSMELTTLHQTRSNDREQERRHG